MAYVISIANQKGGVGKTTTATSLAAALGRRGRVVLLIDLDPQGNATSGFGVDKKTVRRSTFDLLVEGADPQGLACKTSEAGVFLIPSSSDLVGIETRLDELNRHFYLRDALEVLRGQKPETLGASRPTVQDDISSPETVQESDRKGSPVEGDLRFPRSTEIQQSAASSSLPSDAGLEFSSAKEHDALREEDTVSWPPHYVILDCPPTLGVLTTNALVASDSLLVPVQAEFYALEGLTELLRTFDAVRRRFNPALVIEGFLTTMYDSRTRLSAEVDAELRRHYPDQVFKAVIPRSVRFGEAPSHGRSILSYDPGGRGAAAFVEIAEEVIQNDTKRARARALFALGRSGPGHPTEPDTGSWSRLGEDFLSRD